MSLRLIRRTALSLLLVLWSTAFFAQNSPDHPPSPASIKIQQARELIQKSDFPGALKILEEALGLARGENTRKEELNILTLRGDVYSRQFQAEDAVQAYQQALALAGEMGDEETAFALLSKLGSAHGLRGEYELALSFHKRALAAAKDDKEKMERVLTDIGMAHYYAGQFELALAAYDRAIAVARGLGERGHEGFIQVNRGEVYRRVHDYEKAREAYLRAEAFAAAVRNKNLEWAAVRSLANVALETGALDQALKHNLRALELSQELGSKDGLAGTLTALGKAYMQQGRLEDALSSFERSRALYTETGSLNIMHPLNYIGDLYALEQKFDQALSFYRQSLERAETGNVFNYQIDMNTKIGRVLEVRGDFPAALAHYLRAMEEVESVRGQAGGEAFKTGFLKGYYEVFESALRLLLKMHRLDPARGYDRQAFACAEKSKARSFLDSLQEARLDLAAGLSPALRREKHEVTRRMSLALSALQRPGVPEDKRPELLAGLRRAETDYDRFLTSARSESPSFEAFTSTKPHDLIAIQSQLLDPGTLLLEYFLGEDASWAFAVSRDALKVYELPPSLRLEAEVSNYLLVLRSTAGPEYREPGRRLADLLLAPLRDLPTKGIDRLIIIPDGKLHYLPFEALLIRDETTAARETCFVAEKFRVSYGPSASLLLSLGQRPAALGARRDLLGFADPVFSLGPGAPGPDAEIAARIYRDSYLDRGFDLPRLTFSGVEMRAIARQFSSDRERTFLQQRATEDNFKQSDLKGFKIIHLATHGFMDEKEAARSAVVLSLDEDAREDGFLLAREIYQLELDSDLVVLSACQTARGKLEKGEGVCGLYRAFLYAGARSVLVSLWRIQDRSTADFMRTFYQNITAGLDKEEALRQAKVRMLKSGRRHPSAWAAFILIGEGAKSIPVVKPSLWERFFKPI